jgi:Cytochrome C oxidase, cbb3-type, subunit III
MIKTWFKLIGSSLLILLFVYGCTKENEEKLSNSTGTPTCKTDSMSYSNNVVPIMQSYCFSCHGNGNTGGSGGINLEGYNNLKPYVDNGKLVGNITHAPGYVPMPYGQPKMPDCEINQIVAWVDQGAKNN